MKTYVIRTLYFDKKTVLENTWKPLGKTGVGEKYFIFIVIYKFTFKIYFLYVSTDFKPNFIRNLNTLLGLIDASYSLR